MHEKTLFAPILRQLAQLHDQNRSPLTRDQVLELFSSHLLEGWSSQEVLDALSQSVFVEVAAGWVDVTMAGRLVFLEESAHPEFRFDWRQARNSVLEAGFDQRDLPAQWQWGADTDAPLPFQTPYTSLREALRPYLQFLSHREFVAGEGTIRYLFGDDQHALVQSPEGWVIVDLAPRYAPREIVRRPSPQRFLAVGDRVRYGEDGVSGPLVKETVRHWMVLEFLPIYPEVGLHVRLKGRHNFDRFPHFIVPARMAGQVVDVGDDHISVQMAEYIEGADEWENCIVLSRDESETGLITDVFWSVFEPLSL